MEQKTRKPEQIMGKLYYMNQMPKNIKEKKIVKIIRRSYRTTRRRF